MSPPILSVRAVTKTYKTGFTALQAVDLEIAGLAILLSEQNWQFAAALADHAVLLEQGRIVGQGEMAALIAAGSRLAAVLGM